MKSIYREYGEMRTKYLRIVRVYWSRPTDSQLLPHQPKHLSTRYSYTPDVCHEKIDLEVFVVVIPMKDGCAWYETDFSEFDSADIIDYILEKLVSCQKKDVLI